NDVVELVLVTLRDVTLVRGLAHSVARAEREATLIARILDAGLPKFLAFCAASREKLAEASDLLSSPAALGEMGIESVSRTLHTIKGNAGMLALDAVVRAAHDAEDLCRPHGDAGPGAERAAARDAVRALAELVADQEALAKRKLGAPAATCDARQARQLQGLAAIEARLADASEPETPLLAELRAIIDGLTGVPLHELFEDAARNLPDLARELGRAAPLVECDDAGLRLASEWAPVLADALVHVLRNALDHGIEPADERLATGKPARGRITLRAEKSERSVRLRIGDDGRGLALERLRQKADGQPCTDEELAELIFAFGFSTARQVSTFSGRGVGMDAVRSELRRRGGDARAEFTGPARDGYRPFVLVLSLPAEAARAVGMPRAAAPALP
ncbi:MAG TPA: ATP-binding protein, partial [Polyangiaceae bacterium]|nr:ATP-binding protein [Polyangiaceae bacterium]